MPTCKNKTKASIQPRIMLDHISVCYGKKAVNLLWGFLRVLTAVMTQQLSVWTCAVLLSQTSGLIPPLSLQLLQITALWWRRRRPSSATTRWSRNLPKTWVGSRSAPSWLLSKSFASDRLRFTARWVIECLKLRPPTPTVDLVQLAFRKAWGVGFVYWVDVFKNIPNRLL